MKRFIVFVCIALVFLQCSVAFAATPSELATTREYLIKQIIAQIATLQALLESQQGHTITGTPEVIITAPTPFMSVQYGNPYTVSWTTQNIPPSSMLLLDTAAAFLYGGSGVSGGMYQQILHPKNSSQSKILPTGIGYSDPGTYDVWLTVVACADVLCTEPVITYDQKTGKRIYLTKILATSQKVRYSITENAELQQKNNGSIVIGDIKTNTKSMRLGKEVQISFTLSGKVDEGQEACFFLNSDVGGGFSPNSDTYSACEQAHAGLNTRTWTPFRTAGFALNPGLYQIQITVPGQLDGSGKDAANIAEKKSTWIELLPE